MDTENSMDRSEFAASIDNNDGGDSNKGFLFLNKKHLAARSCFDIRELMQVAGKLSKSPISISLTREGNPTE